MIGRETLKLLLLVSLLTMGGLLAFMRRDDETIRTYSVSRPPPRDRMLAAVIPHGEQAWFFKMSGPQEDVAPHVPAFRELIESLRFGSEPNAPPEWKLPAGWKKQPGSQMRFATLVARGDDAEVECTVTMLPITDPDRNAYILQNVNRWRDQMHLGPLRADELSSATQAVQVGEVTATLVDLAGELSGGMGRSPLAGGTAGGTAGGMPGGVPPRANGPTDGDETLQYDAPEGWVAGDLEVSRGGITVRRAAVFEVRDGDRRVEITVTKLPASALLANVNRWRGQIGLNDLTDEQYQQSKQQIDFAGAPADYVQFSGDQESILGVIAVREGLAWFAKLQGPSELAQREKPKFESFIQSIRFRASK